MAWVQLKKKTKNKKSIINCPTHLILNVCYFVIYLLILFLFFLFLFYFLPFFLVFLFFSRALPAAYGGSQARGLMGAVAASLHHSHSNARSEPRLQPTPQLTAMLDP